MKKRLLIIFAILVLFVGVLLAYTLPVASKNLSCRVDARYSILRGQKQAYDDLKAFVPGPTQGMCAPVPAGKITLYLL